MPIQVQGPDGQLLEFPDDTSRDTMRAAMQRRYGGPTPAPAAPAAQPPAPTPMPASAPQAPKADSSNVQGGSRSTEKAPATGLKRDLGMSARSVIQGAGGLLGAIGGDAFNHYITNPAVRAAGFPEEQALPYRDAAAGLADRMGLPAPQSSQERILGDVGEALTGTALTMGVGGLLNMARGAPIMQRVGDLLTAQPKLQAISTATGAGAASTARESGAGQGTQLAAGLLGGLGPGVAGATAGATARGLVRGRSGEQMQRTIDDFAKLGATPSVGQASGNWALQGAENLLAGGPTSAGVMGRFAERQADDIGAGLGKIGDSLTPKASGERAGNAIEAGVKQFRRNANATKKALYWDADRHIPGASPTPLANTWRTVVQLTTPNPGAAATTGSMIQPRIAKLRETLEQDLAAGGGTLSYEALKRIRTDIGEAIDGSSPLNPSSDLRELNLLYGSLSDDMEAAARAAGPAAVAAARRANNYTREVAKRQEVLKSVIDKNGGPEAVFNAAMQGTKDGGTRLRAVMQSLPKEGQRAVTAAVIKRMGMPTPGQAGMNAADEFSAATFLTNWNRISPEARRALFDRHGLGFSNDMDRIARVAENIKTGSKAFQNPSGTANRAAALTYGASLVASLFDPTMISLGGVVGGGALANGAARYLTNPRAVRWLARATEMPRGALVSSVAELGREAERSEDEDLLALARDLQQAVDRQAAAGQ